MPYILGVLVLAVAAAIGVSWRFLTADERTKPHNDMLRAGQSPEIRPNDAALRAQGKAAWTRMSGGA
ncbi:hypothetical protein [Microbacterium schleiferi]|uniref:hypothetical protein n=1 Tax=Microbacterium schleiferi TaxID=69362 RepID=UPI00311FA53D